MPIVRLKTGVDVFAWDQKLILTTVDFFTVRTQNSSHRINNMLFVLDFANGRGVVCKADTVQIVFHRAAEKRIQFTSVSQGHREGGDPNDLDVLGVEHLLREFLHG